MVLKSYVDDFFGGPKKSTRGLKINKRNAKLMFDVLIAVGELTGAVMNLEKCCPPARVMEILGFVYDAIARSCRLSKEKTKKYITRVDDVLKSPHVRFKNLEKLVGNLAYAAWISPFGRPFLSVLSSRLNPSKKNTPIRVSPSMKNALIIWRIILSKNQGLSYNFILGRLPHAENEWFVDASSNFGCGGVCGYRYFMVDNSQIIRSKFLGQKIKFEDVSIAYRELLSVVIAFTYFSSHSPSSLIRINADN